MPLPKFEAFEADENISRKYAEDLVKNVDRPERQLQAVQGIVKEMNQKENVGWLPHFMRNRYTRNAAKIALGGLAGGLTVGLGTYFGMGGSLEGLKDGAVSILSGEGISGATGISSEAWGQGITDTASQVWEEHPVATALTGAAGVTGLIYSGKKLWSGSTATEKKNHYVDNVAEKNTRHLKSGTLMVKNEYQADNAEDSPNYPLAA